MKYSVFPGSRRDRALAPRAATFALVAALGAALFFAASAGAATRTGPGAPDDAIRDSADIDAALDATWSRAGANPAPPAPPAVWLRRVWLDLAGVIPTSADVRAFAADPSPRARAAVIERLLAGREWGQRWGRVLARTLIAPRAEPDGSIARALERAIADRLFAGASWPAIAQSLVVGSGGPDSSAAFRSQFAEAPYEVAGQLGSAVFGMRLRCAQCHDDPLHGWKVSDYYGLAAFFGSPRRISVPSKLYEAWKSGKVRNFYELVMNVPEIRPRGADHRWVRKEIEGYANELRQLARMGLSSAPVPQVGGLDWAAYDVYRLHATRRAMKGMSGFGQRTNVLSDRDGADLIMPPLPQSPLAAVNAPAPGRPVTPRWPGFPARPPPEKGNRRAALAGFVGDASNTLVARAFVNRVWAELMGHGLVEPVDEVVRPVDARHQRLLERLAAGFSTRSGSVKWLLATILGTRAYALACGHGDASAALPLPSRPLTRAHYGLEIEVGARALPGDPKALAVAAKAIANDTRAPVENVDPEMIFAVRVARPLDGAEVEACLRRATGRDSGSPELTRALARTFDPESGSSVIDGEAGVARGGLPRGLFLLTGPELQKLVEEAPLLTSLASETSATAALDELFVRTLSRPPEPGERSRLEAPLGHLPDSPAARRPWADMLWALVSSAEFLSNH